MTETCGRCGRRLKNPVFREIGYGRTCAAKWGSPSRRSESRRRRRPWKLTGTAGTRKDGDSLEVVDHHPGAKRPGRNTSGLYLVDHQQNRRLINAVGLDDEDVFQQLAIRMIRAVENYDPDKGKDLEQHIFAQLQYEVLNCKDAAKVYGIKGTPYGARGLTVSLDALVDSGCQICGGVA